jgi:hypothetical protein
MSQKFKRRQRSLYQHLPPLQNYEPQNQTLDPALHHPFETHLASATLDDFLHEISVPP